MRACLCARCTAGTCRRLRIAPSPHIRSCNWALANNARATSKAREHETTKEAAGRVRPRVCVCARVCACACACACARWAPLFERAQTHTLARAPTNASLTRPPLPLPGERMAPLCMAKIGHWGRRRRVV